nr:FAD-binding domain-containing protein [Bradyrhizobium canariense]
MASQSASPCIVWFRDDLRLSDHPALHAAAETSAATGAPQICLYVFDQVSSALQKGLNAIGASLVLRKGAAAQIIFGLARATTAGAVFWNEITQAPHQALAEEVATGLGEIGVASKSFPGDLLRSPDRWFWDTPVDADAGSNPANWQWVAGSGTDAAPYFRVFNPVLQGKKFDPDGAYIRRWVPELAGLPPTRIHHPWSAAPLELASAGVELGKTYPHPIIDHKAGRERALAAYARVRNT